MKPTQLVQKLKLLPASRWRQLSFLVGFDGFVDTLYTVVKTRSSPTKFEAIHSISAFAAFIAQASGMSTNFELVTKQKKIGGNGPILAQALSEMGLSPFLFGTLGVGEIEPLFTPLAAKCKRVISYAAPGMTDALEFDDGKIMLCKHESTLKLNLKKALTTIPQEVILSCFHEADIVAATNWTMIFGMTEFWEHLFAKIAPKIEKRKRTLFVDFADPAKRARTELSQALGVLKKGRKYYRVIIGVNRREAEQIDSLFGQAAGPKKDLLAFTRDLAGKVELDGLVVHTTKEACASVDGVEARICGPYTPTPKITTGGGDNFNAGFLLGLGLNLSLDEALMLATATSGYYVRHAKSPNRKELFNFLLAAF